MAITKRCPRCDTVKDLTDFYADKSRLDGHYPYCKDCERSSNRKPRTENTRLARTRARHRAVQRLIERHKTEFYDELLPEEMRKVQQEMADLADITPKPTPTKDKEPAPAPRLKPGRRQDGQSVADRIAVLCHECGTFHKSGHQCPTCQQTNTPQPHVHVPTDAQAAARRRGIEMFCAGKTPFEVAASMGQSTRWAEALYAIWTRDGRPGPRKETA